MSETRLTSEQEAVVHHPADRHARVLAVAGSGKTTTMAYRIKHLIEELHVTPGHIRVLMFNRLARVQFQERLTEIGIPTRMQPPVHTFHSFSYQLIRQMMNDGLLPTSTAFWLGGGEEKVWLYVNIAISNLERTRVIPPGMIDQEEAMEAISLYKGSLIPPERAGYRGSQFMPLVYAEFEKLRIRQNALTFDDFVPMAVSILEGERSLRSQWRSRARHIVVDEFQDVSYGQLRLIELLAGDKADVMVVGDDDQTIYEWRGARPSYMIREFRTVFANKPHTDYQLSRSFRFGPLIAQAAHNLIAHNTTRVQKSLIAHQASRQAEIHVIEGVAGQASDPNRELAATVVSLVKEEQVPPTEIRVLARTFSQLAGLEAEFLQRGVPYRVVGRPPFFQRKENATLLDYVRISQELDVPASRTTEQLLLSVANTPSRMLARRDLSRVVRSAQTHRATLRLALTLLADDPRSHLRPSQQDRVVELLDVLDDIRQRLAEEPTPKAGDLLAWLLDRVGFLGHFSEYYGVGYESFDRQRAVTNFVGYARGTGLTTQEFVKHIEGLDTTRGAPEDQLVIMTTVFREKGREYDYVVIPDFREGFMPNLRETGLLVFDKAGIVEPPEPSEAVENERRLAYVALTRARKAVFIGAPARPVNGLTTSHLPSRFLDEMMLASTRAVMGSLQRFASGVDEAREELVAATIEHGGIRRITRNLIAEYLKDLGDETLTGELTCIAATRAEEPFAYRHAYAPPTVSASVKQEPQPALHNAWDDVTF